MVPSTGPHQLQHSRDLSVEDRGRAVPWQKFQMLLEQHHCVQMSPKQRFTYNPGVVNYYLQQLHVHIVSSESSLKMLQCQTCGKGFLKYKSIKKIICIFSCCLSTVYTHLSWKSKGNDGGNGLVLTWNPRKQIER